MRDNPLMAIGQFIFCVLFIALIVGGLWFGVSALRYMWEHSIL